MTIGQLIPPNTTVRGKGHVNAITVCPPLFGTVRGTHDHCFVPVARLQIAVLVLDREMRHGNVMITRTARLTPGGKGHGTTRGSRTFLVVKHIQGHARVWFEQEYQKVCEIRFPRLQNGQPIFAVNDVHTYLELVEAWVSAGMSEDSLVDRRLHTRIGEDRIPSK